MGSCSCLRPGRAAAGQRRCGCWRRPGSCAPELCERLEALAQRSFRTRGAAATIALLGEYNRRISQLVAEAEKLSKQTPLADARIVARLLEIDSLWHMKSQSRQIEFPVAVDLAERAHARIAHLAYAGTMLSKVLYDVSRYLAQSLVPQFQTLAKVLADMQGDLAGKFADAIQSRTSVRNYSLWTSANPDDYDRLLRQGLERQVALGGDAEIDWARVEAQPTRNLKKDPEYLQYSDRLQACAAARAAERWTAAAGARAGKSGRRPGSRLLRDCRGIPRRFQRSRILIKPAT